MSGSILIGGLLGVAVILIYILFKLNDKEENGFGDYAMFIIVLGFLLGILILLGKTAVDYEDNCGWLVNNSTTNGSTTSYSYAYTCSENTNTTANTFYELTLWIMRLTIAYVVIAGAFQIISYFGWWNKGGKQE